MTWSKEALIELATDTAKSRGLNVNHFLAVIAGESGWDAAIQSGYPDPTGPNGQEDSWGVAQINLPANRSVTRAMAQNPLYAVPFMADAWAAGLATHWSQWRLLKAKYGNEEWPL